MMSVSEREMPCIATLKDIPSLMYIESRCFKKKDRFSYLQFWYGIKKKRIIINGYYPMTLGYIYFIKNNNYRRIYSLAVERAYQGFGIAQTLIKQIPIDLPIILEVRINNHRAINFYHKNGYKQYGIKHNYYNDGMDAVLMRRDVDEKDE
jgi:ribosomal protein S18 acetylase RimI-like enzyme